MKCPSCSDVTLLISNRTNVEIDYCPQCRGVWLDRGELDKIIERSEAQADVPLRSQTVRERDDDWDDDDRWSAQYGKKRKKRGFLSEMFEFGD